MKETKLIARFALSTALISAVWFGSRQAYGSLQASNAAAPPPIILADGSQAGSASDTIKFVKSEAEAAALAIWADAPPEYNEFMSKFRCSGCSKNCLLISPSCINGKTKSVQASEIYAGLYPEMEI